jgi:hypothetical protein
MSRMTIETRHYRYTEVVKKDSNTRRKCRHAKKPSNFQLTDTNYTTTGNKVCDEKPTYTC